MLYRSKMHLGLKRNFQVMGGAEWLELLCRHIPDRYEHLVPCVGCYANRSRSKRATRTPSSAVARVVENLSELARRAKAAWARLIRKGYEVDPIECPRCKGSMRVIALIEEPEVIRKILVHLGLWNPEPPRIANRAPPGRIEHSAHALVPLTYPSVPDIA